MSNVEDPNPYAPPTTTVPASIVSKSTSATRYALFIVQSVLIVIAWGMIFIDVETILVMGPLLSAIGALNTILAYRRADYGLAGFAISSPLFVIFILVLISFFRWGPSDATRPITLLGGCYAGAAVICALVIHYRRIVQKT